SRRKFAVLATNQRSSANQVHRDAGLLCGGGYGARGATADRRFSQSHVGPTNREATFDGNGLESSQRRSGGTIRLSTKRPSFGLDGRRSRSDRRSMGQISMAPGQPRATLGGESLLGIRCAAAWRYGGIGTVGRRSALRGRRERLDGCTRLG